MTQQHGCGQTASVDPLDLKNTIPRTGAEDLIIPSGRNIKKFIATFTSQSLSGADQSPDEIRSQRGTATSGCIQPDSLLLFFRKSTMLLRTAGSVTPL